MSTPRTLQRFAEVLLKAGIVDELQLKSATAYCEQWGKRLPRVLAELGFANEDEVLEVLGQATRTPVVHLGNTLRDNGALKALGAEFCDKNGVFPITLKDRVLTLAMADPLELQVVDDAGSKAHARVSVVMAAESEIQAAIARHYYGREVAAARQAPRKSDRVSSGVTGEIPAQGMQFTGAEVLRLEAAALNQEKVGAIVRAVQELLAEKGVTK